MEDNMQGRGIASEEVIPDRVLLAEERIRQICENCDDIIIRQMELGKDTRVKCLVVYIETAVSNMMLEDSVIGKLLNHLWEMGEKELREAVTENGLGISDVKELETME